MVDDFDIREVYERQCLKNRNLVNIFQVHQMNKLDKETFTRSDIESSLRKEFPNINKSDISDAIDAILDSITEAVALDEKVEIRGFSTFARFIKNKVFHYILKKMLFRSLPLNDKSIFNKNKVNRHNFSISQNSVFNYFHGHSLLI